MGLGHPDKEFLHTNSSLLEQRTGKRLTISVVDPSEDAADFAGDLPLALAEAEAAAVAAWQAWAANLQISASSSGDFPLRKSGMEG